MSTEHGSVPVPVTVTPTAAVVSVTVIFAETPLLTSETMSLTRSKKDRVEKKRKIFFPEHFFFFCLCR